jgi:hypothetical protein
MPPYAKHAGYYVFGTVEKGGGQVMEGAAFIRVVPDDQGALTPTVLDEALRTAKERKADIARLDTMGTIRSREPLDVEFGTRYKEYNKKFTDACAEEATARVGATEKIIKATEKKQEIESKKVDCLPLPQDQLLLLKQHKIPAVNCGQEKMLETLNNFVSHYEVIKLESELVLLQKEEKDIDQTVKECVKEKKKWNRYRTEIEDQWQERLKGDRTILVANVIKDMNDEYAPPAPAAAAAAAPAAAPPAAEDCDAPTIRLKRKFSWVTADKSVEADVDALLELIKQGFDGSDLTLDGMMQQWFENLDKDRSGKVDRAEFSAFIKEYTNIEQAAADKIFDHIDGNISGRDGNITKDELFAAMQEAEQRNNEKRQR